MEDLHWGIVESAQQGCHCGSATIHRTSKADSHHNGASHLRLADLAETHKTSFASTLRPDD
jgi:hypothetical protein